MTKPIGGGGRIRSQMRRLALVLPFLLLPAAVAGAADGQLAGTVGPGYSIRLLAPNGDGITKLDPGSYTVVVDDLSNEHNFHLKGPGVNQATGVDEVEKVSWPVNLVEGYYEFYCDPHFTTMKGKFTVGNPPPPPPPPAKPGALAAQVGPGAKISLKRGGAVAKTVPAGAYVVTVKDLSRTESFHLTGPGVDRKTAVGGMGTQTWKVTLKAGGRYVYRSDKTATLRGSFTAK